MPVRVVTTRLLAASITVMLLPYSSATQTAPAAFFGETVGAGPLEAAPLHTERSNATPPMSPRPTRIPLMCFIEMLSLR